jgi:hypothetical protein
MLIQCIYSKYRNNVYTETSDFPVEMSIKKEDLPGQARGPGQPAAGPVRVTPEMFSKFSIIFFKKESSTGNPTLKLIFAPLSQDLGL